jgi:vancomycin resistance protein YoaR
VRDTMTAQELGITEEVISATTYYAGSTANRRTNIQVAASQFHGVVIPPHTVFSFNQYLGDVSEEEGYETGLIILGDQTITGVGGGVCQVSSTLFQAAFYGGFPIVERYPHGYRVAYYEAGEGPGMDATVFSPIVDFKFENDTDYHLLLEVYVRPANSSMEFKLYSTSVGRVVTKEGPYVRNVTPPGSAIYQGTPGVRRGQAIQIDYAVSGADVYVYRTIKDADGHIIVDKEEFFSRYIPWAAQFQVAPDDPRVNR